MRPIGTLAAYAYQEGVSLVLAQIPGLDVRSLPIRLTHTTTTRWVLPVAGANRERAQKSLMNTLSGACMCQPDRQGSIQRQVVSRLYRLRSFPLDTSSSIGCKCNPSPLLRRWRSRSGEPRQRRRDRRLTYPAPGLPRQDLAGSAPGSDDAVGRSQPSGLLIVASLVCCALWRQPLNRVTSARSAR